MNKVNCDIVTPEFRTLLVGLDKWRNSSKANKIFNDPSEAALKLAKTNFSIDLKNLRYVKDLTMGQVKSYLARLDELTSKVNEGKLDSNFAQFFYQSSHYGAKDPVIGTLLNDMQASQFKFQSNEVQDRTLIKNLHETLREEALDRGFQKSSLNKSERNSKKLNDKLVDTMAEWKTADSKDDAKGRREAEEKMIRVKSEIDDFTKNSHLQVYDEMIDMIEVGVPKALKEKFEQLKSEAYDGNREISRSKAKLLGEIIDGKQTLKLTNSDIAKLLKKGDGSDASDKMVQAATTYIELMDKMYFTLKNGVNKRIDSVIQRMKHLNQIDANDEAALQRVKESMRKKYMPDYEAGFFPHYVRDLNAPFMQGLMKNFDDLQSISNNHNKSKGNNISQVIRDMDLYVSGHVKSQVKNRESGESGFEYSRDFFNSIDNYVSDVNKFNFTSFMDGYMLDALTSVERIYKANGTAKDYAQNLVDFITDMNRATNGDVDISPKTRAWMRTLLGFEFTSKLGINPRAAARNWFQRLLDYVTWGPVQVSRSKEYLRTISLKQGVQTENYIDSVLKDNGLLFEEVSPEFLQSGLQAPASAFKLIEWDNNANKFVAVKKSTIEKVADGVSTIAGKSSFIHRKAENANRKHTFKIGYSQLHKWLNTPEFRKNLANEGKTDAQIDATIRKASENYAVNMVVMNHFDYADYAKSKALRSKAGRFFGQFQHYSFEFFERNMKILREAKYDVSAGKLLPGQDAQGLSQAYRMGLVYFLAPVLASAYTGLDFTNLVEHDTAQRIKQWSTLFLGDDEEVNEAFYGKGPLISTFGGPITSDIIEIGKMLDLVDLSEDNILTLITGLEQYDPNLESNDITKKIRLLNTFAGRFLERHLPQLREGRIGWAIQAEAGLYPSAEAKKKQKKLDKIAKQVIPQDIARALEQLQQSAT